ncbi:MAG: vWA domain-containing protein [Actinomycetota bacterium]
MVLLAIILPVLMGIAALVIDIGHGYLVQRRLQGVADSAALAGAANLPSASSAVSAATSYGAGPSGANAVPDNVTESVTTKCLTTFGGCSPSNAVVVDESARVNTYFARVLGIGTFTVHVKSTACSPCGEKPLDIVVVLDRTLSMCMDHWGNSDPSCTDLNAARNGIFTFLKQLDPAVDNVGLVELPPAPSASQLCAKPALTTAYDSKSSPYVLAPLANTYATKAGTLNSSSPLVSTLTCTQGGGETAYALALEAAQGELVAHGRSGVQKMILLFSDGAANTGPAYLPSTSPYRVTPCHQGVSSAATIKAAGTLIYSIGYDLDALNGGANTCQSMNVQGPPESPAITAYQALQGISSGPSYFYDQPSATDLSSLFTAVATNMLQGTAHLVSNATP